MTKTKIDDGLSLKMLEALKAAEKADTIHSKCDECQEYGQAPEVCEHCFPSADDARVMRRNVLAEVKKSLAISARSSGGDADE